MHFFLFLMHFLSQSMYIKTSSLAVGTPSKTLVFDSFFDSCLRFLAIVTFCMALYAIFFGKRNDLAPKPRPSTTLRNPSYLSSEEKLVYAFLKEIETLHTLPTSKPAKQLIQGQSDCIPQLRRWYFAHHPYLDLDNPEDVDRGIHLPLLEKKCKEIYGLEANQPSVLQSVFKNSIPFTKAIKSVTFEYCNQQRWNDIEKLQQCMPSELCLRYFHFQVEIWRHHDEGGLILDLFSLPLIMSLSALMYILSCPRYPMKFKETVVIHLIHIPITTLRRDLFPHSPYQELLKLLARHSEVFRFNLIQFLEHHLQDLHQEKKRKNAENMSVSVSKEIFNKWGGGGGGGEIKIYR